MPERDTYQLVLQLKDELSAELKQINTNLKITKVAAKEVANNIKPIREGFRQSIAPLREFAFQIRNVMAMGGLVMVARSVYREMAALETAFIKANPAMATAAGSAANFGKVMEGVKVRLGSIINDVLSPLRAWFINLVDPTITATEQLKSFNKAFGELLAKYGSAETLAQLKYNEALIMQKNLQIELAEAQRKRIDLTKDEAKAQEALNKVKKEMLAGIPGARQAELLKPTIPVTPEMRVINEIITKDIQLIEELRKWLIENKPGGPGKMEIGGLPGRIGIRDKTLGMLAYPKGGLGGPSDIDILGEIEKEQAAYLKQLFDRVGELNSLNANANRIEIQNADYVNRKNEEYQRAIKERDEKAYQIFVEMSDALTAMKEEQLRQAMGFFGDPMAEMMNVLKTTFGTAYGTLGGAGATDFTALFAEGLNALTKNIISVVAYVTQIVTGFFAAFLENLGLLAVALLPLIGFIALIVAVGEILTGVWEILGPTIESMWKPISGLLQGIGNALGTLLLPIFQALEPVIGAIVSVLMIFLPLFQLLEPIFKILGVVLKALFVPVIVMAMAIIGFLNAIIRLINIALGWLGVNIAYMAMPTMPTFHEGGVAQDEMVALLKKGEIVMNPYKSKGYVAGGGMGGITINAPNARYIDANLAAELVRQGLVAMRA